MKAFCKTNSLLEVNFEKGNKAHRYSVAPDSKKKNSYVISFVNEKRKIKNKQISANQFESIKNEATRIIWENQYRKPASFENCKEYMNLRLNVDKVRICQQNVRMTGKSFGFLNSLHHIFN